MSQTKVLDTTENCRYCLMCRHLCPVQITTKNEALSPHGWAQMVASERRGLMEWDNESIDAMYKCADCGNCESHCVTDQPLPNAIAAARTLLVEKDLVPESVKQISDKLKSSSNLYNGQEVEPPSGKGEVALFIGDEADHFAPGTVEAVLQLLEAAGIQPVVIGRGRNDGLIPSGLGLREQAAELATSTLKDLEATGAQTLLVLSAGSYFTFERVYKERLDLELDDKIELVEVLSLLAQKLKDGELTFNKKKISEPYAYVDPTHSVRVPSRYDLPRTLMEAALEGNRVELFWRKERSGTSGTGGLQFTHPELADELTNSRLEDAEDAGARVVFTEDPATFGRLSLLAKSRKNLDVRNLYQVLAEQL
ncbi:MAG: (Fe-S)-binding protein [Balneolaceae bacterium]